MFLYPCAIRWRADAAALPPNVIAKKSIGGLGGRQLCAELSSDCCCMVTDKMLKPAISLTAVGLLLGTTFMPVRVDAKSYYVRTTGSDSNTGGHPSSAFRTIGAAAQVMVAGDEVWIGAGTYNEQVTCPGSGNAANAISYRADTSGKYTGDAGTVTISSSGIPFRGNGKNFVTIAGIRTSGGSPGMSFVGGSNIKLQNCDISGANHGVIINAATVTLTNCSSHNNSGQGIYVYGAANVTITACELYSNTAYGIYVGPSGTPSATIERTKMYSNTSGGISATNGNVVANNCIIYGSWDGVDVWNGYSGYTGGNVTLNNCVITDSSDDGTWINAGTLTITNTIIAYNHSWGINVAGGSCGHSYNVCWSNGYGPYNGSSAGTGELQLDPSFVNKPAHDLQLNSGSPCIDAGTTISSVPNDYIDHARPYGGRYDIGPYEYGAPAISHGVRLIKWEEIQ
jgi:parallel beta-helix repeat protein